MTERILINEVGLRDGLQNQPKIISTEHKLNIFHALVAAGLKNFEVTSFVSPKAVPQLADAADLLRLLPDHPQIRLTCLVPNMRGYERALSSGARGIAVVLSATDTLNRKNINMSLDEATAVCGQVVRQAKSDGLFARAYIAAAFACPFEGQTSPKIVFQLLDQMLAAGADELAIADTIGAANPKQAKDMFARAIADYGVARTAAHFHDTRGLASALAWAALDSGVRRFDSSIAGLGGCPFAPGASGNVATEDLAFLFHDLGFETGLDFDKLFDATAIIENLLGSGHGSRILPWYRSQRRNAAAE
jgi:hydroxymethylglutaryl-CoA lyase